MAEARGRQRVEVSRGDVIVSAGPGDFGKPRPAVVVQSDLFNPTHASIVICPITSYLVDAPLFRLMVRPSAENGLKIESQIMVDKITAVRRERIGRRAGRMSDAEMSAIDRALALWLQLGTAR